MYFKDQMQLLGSLNEDCTILLRNTKRREQMLLLLFQYNWRIVDRDRKGKDIEAADEQLAQYQAAMLAIIGEDKALQEEQREVLEKYENNCTSFDGVIKFMARVGAHVIQIIDNSVEKMKAFDQSLPEKINQMKRTLVGILSRKQKINLEHVMNVVLDCSKTKMAAQLAKFQQLIKALKAKQYLSLKCHYRPQVEDRGRLRIGSVQKIRVMMIERNKEYSLNRDERNLSMKKNILRKLKSKCLESLYGIMILSKHQWSDDLVGCSEEKKQKVYQDLLRRNKVNNEHLNSFGVLQQEFKHQIRQFDSSSPQKNSTTIRKSAQSPLKSTETPLKQVQNPLKLTQTPIKQYQNLPKSSQTLVRLSQNQHPLGQPDHILNKSYTEANNKKSKSKLTESIMFNEHLATQAQCNPRTQQPDPVEDDSPRKKMFATRSKFPPSFSSNDVEDFPQIMNKTIHNQSNNRSAFRLQPIKNVHSYSTRKGKLPEINRGASNENRFSLRVPKPGYSKGHYKEELNNMEEDIIIMGGNRKERWLRDDRLLSQRTKMAMKNVEVGMDMVRREESNGRREESNGRKEESVGRERKKTESALMECTAYCKRTLNKFLDTKLNVF